MRNTLLGPYAVAVFMAAAMLGAVAGWLALEFHHRDQKRSWTAVVRASGAAWDPVVAVERVEEALHLVTLSNGDRYQVLTLNLCEEDWRCRLADVWCFYVEAL